MAGVVRAAAMNADVLYHGTRYPKLIIRSGTILRAEVGDEKVCLTRSPEVAAYWALLPRDDDEARGGVFIFDRKSLERRYELQFVPEPYWHSDYLFHDEAEVEIWDDVLGIGAHLVGFVAAPRRRTNHHIFDWKKRRARYRQYKKRVEARVSSLTSAVR